MKDWSHRLLSLLLILIVFGCDSKRDAIGEDNKIIIVVPRPQIEAVKIALQPVFPDTMFGPQPEPDYKMEFVSTEDFHRISTHVNVLVIGLGLDESNPGNQLVKQMLPAQHYQESKQGGDAIFLTFDQYATDQIFMIISAKDQNHLRTELAKQKKWLKTTFDDLFTRRQAVFLYDRLSQEDIEQHLFEDYGWGIKVPWGYTVVKDAPDSNFFWMGREGPYRWISVHWEDGLQVGSPDSAIAALNSFGKELYGYVRFSDHKLKVEQVDFNSWTAWKLSGLWERIDEAQGGPFRHFIFYDGITDRTYQINLTVFSPANEKIIVMRQLDVVARSFFTELAKSGEG